MSKRQKKRKENRFKKRGGVEELFSHIETIFCGRIICLPLFFFAKQEFRRTLWNIKQRENIVSCKKLMGGMFL